MSGERSGAGRSLLFDERPQRVYWEVTRACDLACRHCRAEAVPTGDPDQLTTAEGMAVLDRLAGFDPPRPHVVLTGGDPLKRDDLFDLIAHARYLGLGVSVAPAATPRLTKDVLRRLQAAGVDAISLSLDSASPARHDRLRGVPGTHARTLGAARVARDIGLPFQINTLVCADTMADLPATLRQVAAVGAARWSLFFLVSVGRGLVLQPIAPADAERVLQWAAGLAAMSATGGLVVTTTEAPHFRRVVLEQRRKAADTANAGGLSLGTTGPRHGGGIRDGNGIMFISHTGEICPSGFLEITAGTTRRDDLVHVYRQSPLFTMLREPDLFSGRCGACEYRRLCGGSRARAYAASGDPLGEDPLCLHRPHTAGSPAGA